MTGPLISLTPRPAPVSGEGSKKSQFPWNLALEASL